MEHQHQRHHTQSTYRVIVLGYHVILAVWDVADTANAFYNVIDVDVKGDSAIPVKPSSASKCTY